MRPSRSFSNTLNLFNAEWIFSTSTLACSALSPSSKSPIPSSVLTEIERGRSLLFLTSTDWRLFVTGNNNSSLLSLGKFRVLALLLCSDFFGEASWTTVDVSYKKHSEILHDVHQAEIFAIKLFSVWNYAVAMQRGWRGDFHENILVSLPP